MILHPIKISTVPESEFIKLTTNSTIIESPIPNKVYPMELPQYPKQSDDKPAAIASNQRLSPAGDLSWRLKLLGWLMFSGGILMVLSTFVRLNLPALASAGAGVVMGLILIRAANQFGQSAEANEPINDHLHAALNSLAAYFLLQIVVIVISVAAVITFALASPYIR